MKYFKELLQKNYVCYALVFIVIIFSLFRTNIIKYYSKIDENKNEFIVSIKNIKIDDDKISLNLLYKEEIIGYYYFNKDNEKEYFINNLSIGDKIKIKGKLSSFKNNTVPNTFNYKQYLYNKKIFYKINIYEIEKISNNKNIFLKVKNYIIKRCNNFKYSKNYMFTFILGDDSYINDDVIKSYQNNGISHLFSISGMHISLLTSIILLLLNKINNNKIINYIIICLFLIFYMFLTNYSPSMLRASLFYIFTTINRFLKLEISSKNILLYSFIFLLIINPFFIYDIGFELSYSIVFSLIMLKNKLDNYSNYLVKILIVSIISFLVSLPISIYNFYQINLLGIILNIIFVPFISLIIFPLSLISLVFSALDFPLYLLIKLMENASLFFSNIKILNIILAKPNIIVIIVYYIIIILILTNYKNKRFYYLIFLMITLFIHNNILLFNNKLIVTMIDVGQGDSILIILPNNKGNILIDTGGKINFKNNKIDNSMSINTLIPFFKSYGIKSINKLILSHGDNDHIGNAFNLVDNFKINKVIFNNDGYNDLEKKLINILNNKNIQYEKGLEELDINKNKLIFLNTKIYDNENDNSNVIYFNYSKYKFLFMGDASIKKENDILDKYDIKNIDFLKVAHHGSNTSSSINFINTIKPKVSLISVGENNIYGHPKKEVLNNLSKSKIYRTDLEGSIEIRLNNDNFNIITHKP